MSPLNSPIFFFLSSLFTSIVYTCKQVYQNLTKVESAEHNGSAGSTNAAVKRRECVRMPTSILQQLSGWTNRSEITRRGARTPLFVDDKPTSRERTPRRRAVLRRRRRGCYYCQTTSRRTYSVLLVTSIGTPRHMEAVKTNIQSTWSSHEIKWSTAR